MNPPPLAGWALLVLAGAGSVPVGALAQSQPSAAPAAAPQFAVKAVRIEGNTLLPPSELDNIVQRLVGSERTLADLRQGAAALQQAYRDAGYGGVVAYVPEQELADGTVVIRVVEGKLARVQISGNKHYDEQNIRRSLPNLREGETPLVRAIDRDIQLANENPAKQVQVQLRAGEKPADIDADLEVAEEKPFRVLLRIDNTGNPSTGDYRVSVGLQDANLWNRDHIGTLWYQTSPTDPSLVQVYSVGYRLPLYGLSSSIDAFYAHSSVENGTTLTPAGPLQFSGEGDVLGFRFNRYLARIGEYDQRLTLGADWQNFDNACSVGQFGSAACGPAAASVQVIPLSLAYTGQKQGPELSWGFSGEFVGNVGGSSQPSFEAARPGAEKYFTLSRLSAFVARALPARFGVNARVAGQYSPDALIPGEQFGLGGADTVRGYYEREIAGDYGFVVNLEALGPAWGGGPKVKGATLRPLVFFDYGQVTNHDNTFCDAQGSTCSLSSVGIGFRFAVPKWFFGRLDIAYTLQAGPLTEADTFGANFALNFVF